MLWVQMENKDKLSATDAVEPEKLVGKHLLIE